MPRSRIRLARLWPRPSPPSRPPGPRHVAELVQLQHRYEPGRPDYPLANFSWALLYQKQANTNTASRSGKLFDCVVTTGQSYSAGFGYAPLPSSVVTLAHTTLQQLQTASGQPLFTT